MDSADVKRLLKLFFLVSPVRPQRLLQKLVFNLCAIPEVRSVLLMSLVKLLTNNVEGVKKEVSKLESGAVNKPNGDGDAMDGVVVTCDGNESDFPPDHLIGVPPEVVSNNVPWHMSRRARTGAAAAAIAANLPASARGGGDEIPSIVARRLVDTVWYLVKNSPAMTRELLLPGDAGVSCFELLLDLLGQGEERSTTTPL